MKAHDSIRLWFQYLGERGEYPNFSVMEVPHRNPLQVKEYEFFHGEMDGIGGILKVLEENEKAQLVKPLLPERRDPPAIVYLINFFRYLARIPFYSQKWNLPTTGWQLTAHQMIKPTARAYVTLSKEDTAQVWQRAREAGAGRNAFLLYHLNRVLTPHHRPDKKWKRYWLIPVSLRTKFNQHIPGNFTGFIDAKITEATDEKSLHESLKRSLLRGEAYGGFTGISLGRLIGAGLLKVLVGMNDYLQVRTGVFTNLGNWQTEGQVSLEADWFGFPPVIKAQPVGAMICSVNGQQSLALQFHPILSHDEAFARDCLNKWVQSLIGTNP